MIARSTNKDADTQLKKDLLLFFQNRHPYAKCSPGVISYAVSRIKKIDLEEALEGLIADELIEKHTNRYGQLYYCLAIDPKKQEPVLRLPAYNGDKNEGCNPVLAFSSS